MPPRARRGAVHRPVSPRPQVHPRSLLHEPRTRWRVRLQAAGGLRRRPGGARPGGRPGVPYGVRPRAGRRGRDPPWPPGLLLQSGVPRAVPCRPHVCPACSAGAGTDRPCVQPAACAAWAASRAPVPAADPGPRAPGASPTPRRPDSSPFPHLPITWFSATEGTLSGPSTGDPGPPRGAPGRRERTRRAQ